MCRADVEGGADVAHGDVAGARERAVASCARLLGDIARGAEDDETREDIASATEALRRATSLVVSSNANRGGDGGGGAEVVAAACGVLTELAWTPTATRAILAELRGEKSGGGEIGLVGAVARAATAAAGDESGS